MDIKFDKYTLDSILNSQDGKLLEEFNRAILSPSYTLKDTGFTQKTISYWDEQGLLFFDKSMTGKWRRFPFLYFVWLKIIDEYRSVGVPVKLIKKLKEDLFTYMPLHAIIQDFTRDPEWHKFYNNKYSYLTENDNLPDSEALGYPLLYYMLLRVIVEKVHIAIILFKDGECTIDIDCSPSTKKEFQLIEEDRKRMAANTYISVSLSSIIKDFLLDASMIKIKSLHMLSENEITILEAVKSGEYESISIEFKANKPHMLNLKKSEDVGKRVVDILSEGEYQSITIHERKGKVVKVENIKKVMLE